jgi:hypothetical protein
VLARLDQINGIASSFVNESGTLIRLSLRPGADAGKIARVVQHVVSAHVADRVPVQLGSRVAATMLQREIWQDQSQTAELAATEMRGSVLGAPGLLAGVLLACVLIGIGLVCWRYRTRSQSGRVDPENA